MNALTIVLFLLAWIIGFYCGVTACVNWMKRHGIRIVTHNSPQFDQARAEQVLRRCFVPLDATAAHSGRNN